MQSFPTDLKIIPTRDGSPSLAFRRPDGYEEPMHHSGGALAESVYVYLTALRQALQPDEPIRILSVGLGLGYNEILAVAEMRRLGRKDFKIYSFEAVDFLRESFHASLMSVGATPLQSVLHNVIGRVADALACEPSELCSWLREALHNKQLELRQSFPDDLESSEYGPIEPCNVVFYDAYSSKMDPDLWQEQVLQQVFLDRLSANCVFASYASTGNLRRALKQLGFCLTRKAGFARKRECTFAFRRHFL
jgi:tRNA U34 5-methylaminomethyl-2-thiouridine-forming methyltransferase MnmC